MPGALGTPGSAPRPAMPSLFSEAVFHESLALVTLHFFLTCLLVARLHLVLLRGLLVIRFGGFLIPAFQARAHELLAVIAFAVAGLGGAVLHTLRLRLLLRRRFFLHVAAFCGFVGRHGGFLIALALGRIPFSRLLGSHWRFLFDILP